MYPVLAKTFGGLNRAYYFRQLFFGSLLGLPILLCIIGTPNQFSAGSIILVSIFLYPYSRFVYEGVMSFILGENQLLVNLALALTFKFITMALCFSFAIIVAPLGLLYLYIFHNRSKKQF